MRANKKVKLITLAALIAAIYAVATYLCSVFGIAYGPIQFRFSEALTVAATITPAAIPGLTIGCIISNIASPLGIWDIIFGSLATLISAALSYFLKSVKIKNIPLLSILMPVIFNGIIIGCEIYFLMPTGKGFTAFLITCLEIAAGEAVVCLIGGIPLYKLLSKIIDKV